MDTAAWTWVLHSSLLIAAIYGRFTKVWSVRNLDLVLLIGLTPALFVYQSYAWILYSVSALFCLRLIFDCRFMRRPRVEPNMNAYGVSFLCLAAFIVLVVRVFTQEPSTEKVEQAENLINRTITDTADNEPTTTIVTTQALAISRNIDAPHAEQLAMRIVSVVAHAAIVVGLLVLGYKHFGSYSLGLAMSSLYLLLPCTAFYVHQVKHTLPAAFLVWAFVFYRRPVAAGSFLAMACGALFTTVFLLPLWAAYYGRKKLVRFGTGLAVTGLILTVPFLLTSLPGTLPRKLIASMNWSLFSFLNMEEYRAAETLQELARPHIMIVFFCVFLTITIWPRKKQLSHLIAHSAVLVVLAQLWYPQDPGLYVLWYLPLLILVAFRPRLRHLAEEEEPREAPRLAPTVDTIRTRPTVASSPLRG